MLRRLIDEDDYVGLEVILQAGTRIARDETPPIVTAYDDYVLIMPTRTIKRGEAAARFGRYHS